MGSHNWANNWRVKLCCEKMKSLTFSTVKVLSLAIIFASFLPSSNSFPARDDDTALGCDECIVIFENNGVCECINSNCDPYEAGFIPVGCSQQIQNNSTCVDQLSQHFAHCAPQNSGVDDIRDLVGSNENLGCVEHHGQCSSPDPNDECKKDPNSYEKCCCPGDICRYTFPHLDGQRRDLCRGVECVVATPGRLMDLMQEEYVDLSEVSYLVLDEADRMLDQGFERDIRAIIGSTHPQRQTCLFSATWPDSVRGIASEFLTKPIRVTIGSEDLAAGTNITQCVEVIDDEARLKRLLELLKEHHSSRKNRIIIFVLYKKEAARIEWRLQQKGW